MTAPVYRFVGTEPATILAFLEEACQHGADRIVVARDVHDAVLLRPRPASSFGVSYFVSDSMPSGHALALPSLKVVL